MVNSSFFCVTVIFFSLLEDKLPQKMQMEGQLKFPSPPNIHTDVDEEFKLHINNQNGCIQLSVCPQKLRETNCFVFLRWIFTVAVKLKA